MTAPTGPARYNIASGLAVLGTILSVTYAMNSDYDKYVSYIFWIGLIVAFLFSIKARKAMIARSEYDRSTNTEYKVQQPWED